MALLRYLKIIVKLVLNGKEILWRGVHREQHHEEWMTGRGLQRKLYLGQGIWLLKSLLTVCGQLLLSLRYYSYSFPIYSFCKGHFGLYTSLSLSSITPPSRSVRQGYFAIFMLMT